jgi:hypothetical protein
MNLILIFLLAFTLVIIISIFFYHENAVGLKFNVAFYLPMMFIGALFYLNMINQLVKIITSTIVFIFPLAIFYL